MKKKSENKNNQPNGKYDHAKVEAKWAKKWREVGIYEVDTKAVDPEKKFYNLMMFPYPSAEGLHVGNMYAFTGADVYGRFQRMLGKSVFEPIGLDGFGIHSENYAIKVGKHPAEQAKVSEERFYQQLSGIGDGFAWDNRLETYDPEYYKWTQWLFVQMFKHGLAYRGSAKVNWCPSCKTVLADEQVLQKSQISSTKSQTNSNSKSSSSKQEILISVCERCDSEVERREMASWYFRITEYADRLLENIDGVADGPRGLPQAQHDPGVKKGGLGLVGEGWDPKRDGLWWPEKIKTAQRNWIGKKQGVNIKFQISNIKSQTNSKFTIQNQKTKDSTLNLQPSTLVVECFTTRLDTVFGVSFVVVAPELVNEWQKNGYKVSSEVAKYVQTALSKTEQQRKEEEKEKTGVDTGLKAINPVNGDEVPVYVADYVLMDYGTGAVMGVPAHDERDFEFAKKYGLEVVEVVENSGKDESSEFGGAEYGKLVNSGEFDGLTSKEAIKKIAAKYSDVIEPTANYHLRDWLISRQRYWGPPIPMIFCEKCKRKGRGWLQANRSRSAKLNTSRLAVRDDSSGTNSFPDESNELGWDGSGWWPVPEEELPVKLPEIEEFKPKGDGSSPLENASDEWKFTECPGCGNKKARRELDVSDTFLDSSWYFLAYPSVGCLQKSKIKNQNDNSKFKIQQNVPWDSEITQRWLPVDAYIGGAEHAVLHLLYSRFVTMALHDWGHVGFEEPFPFLFGHGLIIKDGAKMSKSRGNVVNPDEYIEKYGADALRMYLMFLGPFEGGGDFRDTGMKGMKRFLDRVWEVFLAKELVGGETDGDLKRKLEQTKRKMREDLAGFKYNTAIAAFMELLNLWQGRGVAEKSRKMSVEDVLEAIKLIAPLAPFIAEELYQILRSNKSSPNSQANYQSVHLELYPEADLDMVTEDVRKIAVQVNGKLRAVVEVGDRVQGTQKINKKEMIERVKKMENVARFLEGKTIKKVIWIPPKKDGSGLMNLVV